MKFYVYSFLLHLLLVILIISGWFVWKKPESVELHYMKADLVTLPTAHLPSSVPAPSPQQQLVPQKNLESEKEQVVDQVKPIQEQKSESLPPPPPKLDAQNKIESKKEKNEPKKEEIKKEIQKPEKSEPEPVKPIKPSINPREMQALLDEENAQIKQIERQVSANSFEVEQQVVMGQYLALMKQRVERYWSRPLVAANNMQVTLRIYMLPGGEVNNVTIEESSGNAAFDRSAIQAIERAKVLPVPDSSRLFNLYFKSLVFIFKPENL